MRSVEGDGVQSEVPHISDGVIEGLLDTLQLRGVFLQKLAVVLQLDLCVYFCRYESQEYTETDFLLPKQLYGRSRISEIVRAKDADRPVAPTESICSMVLQILVPFLLAGLGTVSAGMLLDVVQNWDVFQEITELFILVNAGKMDSAREKWMLIVGNLALKQLQATVLGLLASLMASVLGLMAEGEMPLNHIVLLCSTSVSTAFVASLLQGIIMVAVIIGSKRMGINPDNVATPMAASFGDLITLALLACCGQWFYSFTEQYIYVLYLVDLLLLCLIPLWIVIASKHPASHILLRTGWEPIITAMVISSIGGLILDKSVSDPNLAGIVVYAPVINGIGGNLVSIQSSRISTNLHLNFSPGDVPEDRKSCYNPCQTFFGSADCMVHCLWRRHKDPDSYSIPYLTALGDLLGTALLSLAFFILWCAEEAKMIFLQSEIPQSTDVDSEPKEVMNSSAEAELPDVRDAASSDLKIICCIEKWLEKFDESSKSKCKCNGERSDKDCAETEAATAPKNDILSVIRLINGSGGTN
ncbi:hypothetical protein INR49_030124 [Caranx melampygus]|nr:hypothetical protein INR49_030124 [Caranx melampygus]